MNSEWWVALFSLIGTMLGSLGGLRLTYYRISQLEQKVEKHNTIIERTYKLEEEQALIEEKINVVNHRVKTLERNGDK